MGWKDHRIGDFLKRVKDPVEVQDDKEYQLVTIKLYHRGVFPRGKILGSEIRAKTMYRVKEGQFILSGIDARNGAFGIIPKDLNGAIVTNDFWYFDIDEKIIDKHFFLELTATSWFDEICKKGSDGTTNRIRLQKDKFFGQTITLPSVSEQQVLREKFKAVKDLVKYLNLCYQNQQSLITQLRQSILQEAVQGNLTADWRKQNPKTESAAELLKRIKAEKEKLIKEKKASVKNTLHSKAKDIPPFDLPASWEWVRFWEVIWCYRGQILLKVILLMNQEKDMCDSFK